VEVDDEEEEDDDEDAPGVDGVDKTANGTVQKRKRKKILKKSKGQNNWICVSGLPADVILEEIRDYFSKVCSCTVLCCAALYGAELSCTVVLFCTVLLCSDYLSFVFDVHRARGRGRGIGRGSVIIR
jgi:hypothetical protein